MKYNIYETLLGFLIIIIFCCCLLFVYHNSDKANLNDGYLVTAKFQDVSGIVKGSNVKVSGIKIGVVQSTQLDEDLFAIVQLKLDKSVILPKDSAISVVSDGLLGSKFILVTPGSDSEKLIDGDEIIYTESALNIESIVQKLIYSFTTSNAKPTAK